MKSSILAFLLTFFPLALAGDKVIPLGPQLVTTNKIGGASLAQWFDAAEKWAKQRDFPHEIQRFAPEILPILLDCFDDRTMDERLSSVPVEKRKDEVERVRISAMYSFLALGEKSARVVPEVIRHLENRSSTGRGILVNAILNLGTASTNTVPLGLEDLKSDSAATKQQGVLILFAAAKYSDAAMAGLIQATDDTSELVRQTAIYALFQNRATSQRANARLEHMLDPKNAHPDCDYVRTVFRIAEESWVGGPRFNPR